MKRSNTVKTDTLLLFASVFLLTTIVAGAAQATRPLPTGPAERTTLPPEDEVESERERNRIVYHLIDQHARVRSFDTTARRWENHKKSLKRAIFSDDDADLRFLIFDDVSTIYNMRSWMMQELLAGFEAREMIIGLRGHGRTLKDALSLLDPDLDLTEPASASEDHWAFVMRHPSGILTELTRAAPDKGHRAAIQAAFSAMREWRNRNEQTPAQVQALEANVQELGVGVQALAAGAETLSSGGDPWTSIHIFESSGTTIAKFGSDQNAGTYKYTLGVYSLASDQNAMDWYRVDFQTISEITNYEMTGDNFGDTSGKCGWWTDTIHADITVTTTDGQWWDFMPSTTVGSTTTGFTIGGEITTTQTGINGAYSQSYGTSDVTITVLANSVDQSIDWTASLQGCHNYGDYPDYSGASSAAKSTYNLNPSVIVAVPTGSQLKFTTSAGGTPWQFTVRKDTIKLCKFADLEVCHTAYKEQYTYSLSITCNQTSCSD